MILVTCDIKDCTVNEVPYGFPNDMKNEAEQQRKLHQKMNHSDKPNVVKVKQV